MDTEKVGKAIKSLRIQAGYTQNSLAALLNVTDKAVSKWERGLSVPDISIITKLSLLLNCDVDNLLEGNVTYLEKTWQGLLILNETVDCFSGTEVYGKPLVYFYLSYFLLAGIGDIYISCPNRDRDYIENTIGDGSDLGIKLSFLEVGNPFPPKKRNTMVVYNNPFVYGPNLTKYFHRAMSRMNGISILTVGKNIESTENEISYDNFLVIKKDNKERTGIYCVPIMFFPKSFFSKIKAINNISLIEQLYAEPMGNGMIGYSINDKEILYETTLFLHYLRKQMGKDIYNLKEIAKNRNFV